MCMWGGVAGAQPPLDKLELQTVETCEIRMEPSLLRCDLRDRVHSGWSSTVQLTTSHRSSLIPSSFVSVFFFSFFLVYFSCSKSVKREGTAQNDGLRVFVKDGLCA